MPTTTRHEIRLPRSYATSAARDALPSIVNELSELNKPSGSLAKHAVEVGPRNQGGVWILPAIDAEAAIRREKLLKAQLALLEEVIEDLELGETVRTRLEANKKPAGRITGVDFIRDMGLPDIVESIG